MGTCSSTHHQLYAANKSVTSFQSNVNIVHLDGKLQQLKNPVKAWHVLSQNPNCFLSSSESMRTGSALLAVSPNEELHLDQMYFLMPMSKSREPLSLQELGALAIKANAALADHKSKVTNNNNNLVLKQSSVSRRNVQRTHPIFSSSVLGCSH